MATRRATSSTETSVAAEVDAATRALVARAEAEREQARRFDAARALLAEAGLVQL